MEQKKEKVFIICGSGGIGQTTLSSLPEFRDKEIVFVDSPDKIKRETFPFKDEVAFPISARKALDDMPELIQTYDGTHKPMSSRAARRLNERKNKKR